jgi:histidine ammonia-lyase
MLKSNENLSKLQENLVKSHSCGTGGGVPIDIVKLMLLKIQSELWTFGHSITNSRAIDSLIIMIFFL